jgi:hypothetical protein
MVKVTCTKEQAIHDILKLKLILKHVMSSSDDPNKLHVMFEELARTKSNCRSVTWGGDLRFFGRKMMNGAVKKPSFCLRVGKMSDVVDTSRGRRSPSPPPPGLAWAKCVIF